MVGYIPHIIFCNQDVVVAIWKQLLVSSVYLSQEPFYPVSRHRTADFFACSDPDAGMKVIIWSSQDDQMFGDQTCNLIFLSPLEIDAFPYPLISGEFLV